MPITVDFCLCAFVSAHCCWTAVATLTTTSHSSVSFVGDDVSFSCTTNRSVPVRWLRSSTGVPEYVYNGYAVNPTFASRYEVIVSKTVESQTTSTLTIRRTQLTDAGTFTCHELIYDAEPSGLSVNMSVFDPKCLTKPSLTNDRQSIDVLAIICEVIYNGSATATNITCLPVVPYEAVAPSDTDNRVTYVKTIYNMKNVNTSAFTCSMSTTIDGAVFTRQIWNSSFVHLTDYTTTVAEATSYSTRKTPAATSRTSSGHVTTVTMSSTSRPPSSLVSTLSVSTDTNQQGRPPEVVNNTTTTSETTTVDNRVDGVTDNSTTRPTHSGEVLNIVLFYVLPVALAVVFCVLLIAAVCCCVKCCRRQMNDTKNRKSCDETPKGNRLSPMYSVAHKTKTDQSKSPADCIYSYTSERLLYQGLYDQSSSRYSTAPDYAKSRLQVDEDNGQYVEI